MTRSRVLTCLGYVIAVIAALICIHYVCEAVHGGMRPYDFQYNPVRILLNGENPYLYSLNHVKFDGWIVASNQVPSCLALLIPFAFLSRDMASSVWAYCNVIFTLIFLYYVYRIWFEDKKIHVAFFALSVFLLITGVPWRTLVGNGQHLMFSLAFFMAAYYYSEKDRPYLGGVMLALSAFKYTTIAPMCFIFLYRKWWKSIGIAALIHVALSLGVAAWLQENPLVLIIQSLKVPSALVGQGSADIVSALVQSGYSVRPLWVNLSYLFYTLMCFLVLFGSKNDLLKLAMFSLIANVMFYHRIYDFVVLLIPFLCLLRMSALSKSRLYLILTLLSFIVLLFGVHPAKTFQLIYSTSCPCVVWTISQHLLLIILIIVNFYDSERDINVVARELEKNIVFS